MIQDLTDLPAPQGARRRNSHESATLCRTSTILASIAAHALFTFGLCNPFLYFDLPPSSSSAASSLHRCSRGVGRHKSCCPLSSTSIVPDARRAFLDACDDYSHLCVVDLVVVVQLCREASWRRRRRGGLPRLRQRKESRNRRGTQRFPQQVAWLSHSGGECRREGEHL